MNRPVLFFFFCASIAASVCARNLPPFVKKCKRHDDVAARNRCIEESVAKIQPHLSDGLAALFIPPIDPLEFPVIQVATGDTGSVNLDLALRDVKFYGVVNFRLDNVSLDLEDDMHLGLTFYLPKLLGSGKYHINGKALFLTLESDGDAQFNISEVVTTVSRKLKLETRNGKEYVKFQDDHSLDIAYEKLSFWFENIIPGNKPVSDQINGIFNENYKDVGKDIIPIFGEAIYRLVYRILEQITHEYTLKELFD